MRRCEIGRLCVAVLLGLMLPAAASAQSTIAGLVTDATGGVLPGVTVEAASPALIEKTRAVTSDAEGRYSIVDIRPGTYIVTFTLSGFTTVRREGIEVTSNVSVPINAEMRVGAVEETITVSGQTPVVDVQTVTRRSTMDRQQLETLPITRNAAQMLALAPGVKVNITNGRAGVQGATENVFVAGRGLTMYETRWNLDGMDARTGNLSGLANLRLNDAMVQETVFETFGASIEAMTGGISLNQIPRDGGNKFSGQLFWGGNRGSWVADNLTDELRAQNFEAATKTGPNMDGSLAFGGPVKRDRLWFYSSWRYQRTRQYQADTYDQQDGIRDETNWWILEPQDNWRPMYEQTPNHNFSGRLTSQLTQGQKLTAHYDRMFTSLQKSDPYAYRWDQWSSNDFIGQLKYTNTLTSRLMLDAGLSVVSYEHHGINPPNMTFDPFTPGWYRTAVRRDLTTGRELYGWQTLMDARDALRRSSSTNLTYVTGSHTFKTGLQLGDNSDKDTFVLNGDIIQQYRNGVPDSVLANNTPTSNQNDQDLELGLYAGDTWAINRLTVNGGFRFDRWEGSIHEYSLAAGRFVKARTQPYYKGPTQNNITGRFGATYDLFGNAKTALKVSVGRYLGNVGTMNLKAANPQIEATTSLVWNDSNGDRLAQDNEIEDIRVVNPAFYNGNFANSSLAPDWKREFNWERSFGVQHQLFSGLAVNAMYYHRTRQNIQWTDRLATSSANFFPVDVVTPFNEIVTAYNLPNELRSVYSSSPLVLRTDTDPKSRRVEYDGIELSTNGRLPGGGRVQVGWSYERDVTISCGESSENPNLQRFCDFVPPFRSEYKASVIQRLPLGIDASVTLNSLAGRPLPRSWTITRTLRYPAGCPGLTTPPCRLGTATQGGLVIDGPQLNGPNIALQLVAPGSLFYDRYNDMGVGLSRVFNIGSHQMRAAVSIFNALNGATIITQGTNLAAPASYGRPTATQESRTVQASVRYSF